jgi:uncharacterized membrane protein
MLCQRSGCAWTALQVLLMVSGALSVLVQAVQAAAGLNAVQDKPSEFFNVRPRIIKALQGFGLLLVLVTAGAVMLHYTEAHSGTHLSWLDCWCAAWLPALP